VEPTGAEGTIAGGASGRLDASARAAEIRCALALSAEEAVSSSVLTGALSVSGGGGNEGLGGSPTGGGGSNSGGAGASGGTGGDAAGGGGSGSGGSAGSGTGGTESPDFPLAEFPTIFPERVTRCDELTCPENSTCVQGLQVAQCVCDVGFRIEGDACVDVDECSLEIHGCHEDASCENSEGSYTSPPVPPSSGGSLEVEPHPRTTAPSSAAFTQPRKRRTPAERNCDAKVPSIGLLRPKKHRLPPTKTLHRFLTLARRAAFEQSFLVSLDNSRESFCHSSGARTVMAVVLVRVRSVDLAQRALSASRPSQRNCRAS